MAEQNCNSDIPPSDKPPRSSFLNSWRSKVPIRFIKSPWTYQIPTQVREMLQFLLEQAENLVILNQKATKPFFLNLALQTVQSPPPTSRHRNPVVSMNLERSPISTIRPPTLDLLSVK